MDQDASPRDTFDLIKRHLAGDQTALGTLIRRYYPRIERIVRVRLGPALQAVDTVADVVQDVLVRVLEGLEGYVQRDDADWIDWVARIAQREIQDHARSARAQKRGGELIRQISMHAGSADDWDVAADTTDVHSKVARMEAIAVLDRQVSELPEAQREVILLKDYACGDWRSVAEKMGRSIEACQELHRRARLELAKRMKGKG